MRRFDRAIYAMFLLVLLADVARSRALTPVGADAGLIPRAAGPLLAGANGAAVLALRRADGSLAPIARWKRCGLTLSEWTRALTTRSSLSSLTGFSHASQLVMLSALAWGHSSGFGTDFVSLPQTGSLSLAVFAHTGSPAP